MKKTKGILLTLLAVSLLFTSSCADIEASLTKPASTDAHSANTFPQESLSVPETQELSGPSEGTSDTPVSGPFYEYQLSTTPRDITGIGEMLGGAPALHAARGGWDTPYLDMQVYYLDPYYHSFKECAGFRDSVFDYQSGRLDALFDTEDLPSATFDEAKTFLDQLADVLHFNSQKGEYYTLNPSYMSEISLTWPSPSGIDRMLAENPDTPFTDFYNTKEEYHVWKQEDAGFLALYPADDPVPDLGVPMTRSLLNTLCIIWHPRYGVVYLSCPPAWELVEKKEAAIQPQTSIPAVLPQLLSNSMVPLDYADTVACELAYTCVLSYDKEEQLLFLVRPCWKISFIPTVEPWRFWQWRRESDLTLDYPEPLYVNLDAFTADPNYYRNSYPLP